MPKFRTHPVGELARQLRFVPQETRRTQIDAAEELIRIVDPAKAYPFDFVVYRITGYHPKASSTDLLPGLALLHDLGLLIEQASESLGMPTMAAAEPILSIDDVCERLSVTSKTVQRWRRLGLAARRFVYRDDKIRVGFLLSSVEWFVATHMRQVSAAANLTPLGPDEQAEILRRARRLAGECRSSEDEICRRIGRRLRRSPLAIRHILRRHDQDFPAQAILPAAAPSLEAQEQAEIVQAYCDSRSIFGVAAAHHCPASAVYGAVMDWRLERLARHRVSFHDDPLYHEPHAADAIEAMAGQEALFDSTAGEQSRLPRDLPPYLMDIYRVPLLGVATERALFLKLNFHKYQFAHAWRRLEPERATVRQVRALEALWRQVIDTKNRIVAANLRLVLSVARKHLRAGVSLMDLVSEGNLILMRAADGFDVHRETRFSTYATLALMKGFARLVPQMLAIGRPAARMDQAALADVPDTRIAWDRLAQRDEVAGLLRRLNERERRVVCQRYGIESGSEQTFLQLGRRLGVSKERARQIERSAMAKLRVGG